MTDRNALMELAGRVEKASGPDRALDVLIYKSVADYHTELPRYTASIDAAMQLVPEGKRFSCGQGFSGHGPWARIEPDPDCYVDSPEHKRGVPNRYANTVALALCAAALRARASLEVD